MMMYDYGFHFASAAAAKADATMLAGQFHTATGDSPESWAQDHVIAGVQVWRPSQDVHGTDADGNPTVTHTYLAGFYVWVSVDNDAPIPALLNHSALAFCLNRDAREAHSPFVVKNNIGAVLQDLGCSPVFAMNNYYPIGGYS